MGDPQNGGVLSGKILLERMIGGYFRKPPYIPYRPESLEFLAPTYPISAVVLISAQVSGPTSRTVAHSRGRIGKVELKGETT